MGELAKVDETVEEVVEPYKVLGCRVISPYSDREKILSVLDPKLTPFDKGFYSMLSLIGVTIPSAIFFGYMGDTAMAVSLVVTTTAAPFVGFGVDGRASRRIRKLYHSLADVGSVELAQTLNQLSEKVDNLNGSYRQVIEPLWEEIMVLATSEVVDAEPIVAALQARIDTLETLVTQVHKTNNLGYDSQWVEKLEIERTDAIKQLEQEERDRRVSDLLSELDPTVPDLAHDLLETMENLQTSETLKEI